MMQNTNAKNIEVEIRSLVDDDKFTQLQGFFKKNAIFISKENQETFYFNGPQDLRIQRNKNYAKIWLKKGKLHDKAREEIEIHFEKYDFDKLEHLFVTLGYVVEIKWLRKRINYLWKGVSVSLDDTKGYGKIIELEKLSDEKNSKKTLEKLERLMKSLDVNVTPKKIFDAKFADYSVNWKSLLG